MLACHTKFWLGCPYVTAAVLLSVTRPALAYCRTTTCDPSAAGACATDEGGCTVEGNPIFWPVPTVNFTVDPAGSARLQITGDTARQNFEASLHVWTSVDCGGWTPSVQEGEVRLLTGDEVTTLGIGPDAANYPLKSRGDAEPWHDAHLNTLRFVDQNWFTEANAVALTAVSFRVPSGKIEQADVELNSASYDFAADVDLLAVLTHESGHVWGLSDLYAADSPARCGNAPIAATMCGSANGRGDIEPRTLEADDRAGICAIYPKDRFARRAHGGCSLAGGRPGRGPWGCFLFALVGLSGGIARRSCASPGGVRNRLRS